MVQRNRISLLCLFFQQKVTCSFTSIYNTQFLFFKYNSNQFLKILIKPYFSNTFKRNLCLTESKAVLMLTVKIPSHKFICLSLKCLILNALCHWQIWHLSKLFDWKISNCWVDSRLKPLKQVLCLHEQKNQSQVFNEPLTFAFF